MSNDPIGTRYVMQGNKRMLLHLFDKPTNCKYVINDVEMPELIDKIENGKVITILKKEIDERDAIFASYEEISQDKQIQQSNQDWLVYKID